MRRKYHNKLPLVVLLISILAAITVLIVPLDRENVLDKQTHLSPSEKVHRAYSNSGSLYGVESTVGLQQKFSDQIYGGIVSHHLLSNLDIAKFFFEFSDQRVDRVILLGPNHFYPTAYSALSTRYDYETPFGLVKLDREYITKLKSENLIQYDEDIVDTEHSISSLVPYIAHYLPDATLVPIIVTRNAPSDLIKQISNFFTENNSENTVVIASVDFSHHLYSNAAFLHDLRSISALKSFDVRSVPKLEIDSPQSANILLNHLEAIGAENVSLWQQSSAEIFDNYDSDDVTSYVFAHARKGKKEVEPGVSLLFFGDTMLGRGVETLIQNKIDLFLGIRGPEGNFLKGYDGVALNLEGALANEDCTEADDELLINPDNLSMLRAENITYIGVMNNHFQKCDSKRALALLEATGLSPLMGEKVAVIQGTETDVGILSLYATPIPTDTTSILEKVTKESEIHENLIVSIHWGVEYSTKPTSAQIEFAHAIIDAGADIIIGHHPHVVQMIESYKDGFIIYSLGNFISDQKGELTKTGIAVGTFFSGETKWLFLFPFEQVNGVPTHMTQEKSATFCKSLLTENIKTTRHNCILTSSN